MREKLKPCPFCGGEVELVGGPDDWAPTFNDPDSGGSPIAVICGNCACGLHGAFEDYGDAIVEWNRRHAPEPRQLTLDELRQMDGMPAWCETQPDYYKCGVVGKKRVSEDEQKVVIGFSYGWEWATDMLRRGKIYDRPPGGERR